MAALHPNGFLIRLLKTFKNGMRLRLHTWPAGEARLETPHDHRSWFVSLPLWGRFVEKRFVEVQPTVTDIALREDLEHFTVLRCHSTSGNGAPITTPEGKGWLVEERTRVRLPLVPYFCPVDALHSFVPASPGFAASLVLFGPPKQVPRAFVKESRS
jgi:hypothetical protein